MVFGLLIVTGIFMTVLLYRIFRMQSGRLPAYFLLVVSEDDEGVRIAGTGTTPAAKLSDPGDTSATDFFSHQTTGNIQTAMQLGICLAQRFCARFHEISTQMTSEMTEQLVILDSYAVNRFVQNFSDSLIAQTVLSTFYNVISKDSNTLYQIVRDPIPLSLYILRDRRSLSSESYGEIFASLCGQSENRGLVVLANEEYRSFWKQCDEIASDFYFHEV